MPSQDEQHQYFQVSEDDNESSKFIPYIDSKPIPTTRRRSFIKLLPWLLHLLLITGYFFFALHFLDQGKSECFDGPTNAPIIWEQRTFRSEVGNDTVVDFYGPSTPATDARWNALEVGIIRLDEEEMRRLPTETAPLYGNEDGYAGVLEVFHQLHCLNRIRKHFYNRTRNDFGEDPALFKAHDEHCFGYLRQTLMCHADTSVLAMNYDEIGEAYVAKFDVTKQCRSFDAIYEWAKGHQAKYPPPGGS